MNTLSGAGLTNTLTDVFGYANQAADIYSTVKGSGSSQSPTLPTTAPTVTYNPNLVQPTAQPGMSTTTKLIIGGLGFATLVGVAIYMGKSKPKSKK